MRVNTDMVNKECQVECAKDYDTLPFLSNNLIRRDRLTKHNRLRNKSMAVFWQRMSSSSKIATADCSGPFTERH